MNKEEIEERKEYLKATKTVPDLLASYGIKTRYNRCRGFCHNGKDFNMKVFKDGCYCFVCDKSMDIFDIVMHFNYCDFWTAFELLGGTEKPSFTASIKARQAIKKREQAIARENKKQAELRQILNWITAYRKSLAETEPLTDIWIYCKNKLQYQEYLLEAYAEKR